MEIVIYKNRNGKQPFIDWYESIKDTTTKLRIRKRIQAVKLNKLGDSKSLGNGIYELRLFFGKGYRIYYAKYQKTIIILLLGGDKSNQQNDIAKSKAYWQDYKERLNE